MRTTLLIFLLATGLFSLSFSCCRGIADYWNLTSWQIEISDYNRTALVNDTIQTDTLFLEVLFEKEFLSDHINWGPNPFINSALATTCHAPGELGMEDPLLDLQITSSADFNNYPAGTSLLPMLLIDNYHAESWLSHGFFHASFSSSWSIAFPEKPSANSNTHDFKIKMIFDSGREETIQLGALTWI